MRSMLAAVLRNRTSALGLALTTASGFIFLFLVGLELLGLLRSPYAGIVVFLMVPALFAFGLLLMPVGVWRDRRSRRQASGKPVWPSLDLGSPDIRRALLFVAAATVINVALLSFASYGAVQYSDSEQFCGQTCHGPMEPEFVAHQAGPHGRVPCVSCHIEPGAQGFVRAKLNGTRQLALVLTNGYHRPIPSPPTTGVPNVHTSCEQCHWPDRFIGDLMKVVYEYADNEKNTETKTTLRMHVGGPISGTASGTGIHWHMNRGNQVEYVALDSKLEQIPYVRVSTPDGKVREYYAEGVSERDLAGKPRRQMVCIDCHSRPAHRFAASPERSVDAAIGAGLISPKIPFIRREAVKALRVDYPTQDAALPAIERAIRQGVQPGLQAADEQAFKQAIAVTQDIYRRNIFPSMKVGWGTYTNQIGHITSQGCFRCHDESHKTKDGVALTQDCDSCHTIE
jgi:hypothetical protein